MRAVRTPDFYSDWPFVLGAVDIVAAFFNGQSQSDSAMGQCVCVWINMKGTYS